MKQFELHSDGGVPYWCVLLFRSLIYWLSLPLWRLIFASMTQNNHNSLSPLMGRDAAAFVCGSIPKKDS